MTKLQLPALLFFALQAFVVTGQIADIDIAVTCGEDLRGSVMRDEYFRQEGRARLLGITTQICSFEPGSFCESEGTGDACEENETEVDEKDNNNKVTYTVSKNATLNSDLAPCQQVMNAIVARCLDTQGSPPLSSGRSTFRNVQYEISMSSPGLACSSSVRGLADDIDKLFDNIVDISDSADVEKFKESGNGVNHEWWNIAGKGGLNLVIGQFNRGEGALPSFLKRDLISFLKKNIINLCGNRTENGVITDPITDDVANGSWQICITPDNKADQCTGNRVSE